MKKYKACLTFKIKKYLLWPLISQLLLFIFSFMVLTRNQPLGLVFFVLSCLHAALFILFYYFEKRVLITQIRQTALQVSGVQRQHLQEFQLPHFLVDMKGNISWYNQAFADLYETKNLLSKNINQFSSFPALEEFPFDDNDVDKEIVINDRYYRIWIRRNGLESESNGLIEYTEDFFYYSIFLLDITKRRVLKKEKDDQQPVFGYIYLDNYEEVLQSIDEVRKPLLIALVDRHLQRFIKEVQGVLKKFEKDKYLITLKRGNLEAVYDTKFSILDDIREINIGNDLPITISMGIGIHSHDFAESLEYARSAIDLALGRGGDQAVVKNNDKVAFYGGKTKGIETSTRVKARIKAYAFREIIMESDHVIIMGHHNQDLDSLGAAVGVYACARELEKPAHIILDNVSTAVKALNDSLIASGQGYDDILIRNSQAFDYLTEETVVVVVDVNRPSYTEHPELLKKAKKVVVFDHHRVSAEQVENPILRYVEPYASSACEMITEILRYISDRMKLHPVEADALLAGITVDTKNFVIKTGVKTFEAAAFLKRNGADIIRVRELFKNDLATYKARAAALQSMSLYKAGMAIAVSPSDVVNPSLVAAQAADEMLNIQDVRASFVMTSADEVIYISARSFDKVNVQVIMEKLGGGGHMNVAGAQLAAVTEEEAAVSLKQAIDDYLEENDKEDG